MEPRGAGHHCGLRIWDSSPVSAVFNSPKRENQEEKGLEVQRVAPLPLGVIYGLRVNLGVGEGELELLWIYEQSGQALCSC